MQIGCCWFCVRKQQLHNQISDRCWDLEPDEFLVIQYLIEHQGKVVSRLELMQIVFQHYRGRRPYERLEQIIHQLKRFLGDDNLSYIGKMSDQGYVLYKAPVKKVSGILGTPFIKIEALPFFLLLSLGFITFCVFFNRIGNPTSISPNYSQQLTLADDRVAEVSFYTGKQKMKTIKPFANQFISQVSACAVFPWQSISVSVSNGQQMLTIFLDDKTKSTNYKVIKLFSNDFNSDDFDLNWLKQVGICDEV
ncbi:winged helix-turn-helix domain-containing protein [Shewanella xiamenensis]|uniref:winged helix-turn-helix domain-containing protein n=1 Tax=Shewanella xiamenensis TaxID=332186 RepID=UPI0004DA9C9C|nr:helix-turn-helix domain-containing protein [Shewanella xiamenensis]KEK29483.1 response regulator receiver protein [Shewanella xiamenensis]MCL1069350.1 helix-turn-helix domain-containing protein [Shewanella xiamenensis]WHF56472.1 helix-turn-helix domain-containing protein [Shewanella xiamenensis]